MPKLTDEEKAIRKIAREKKKAEKNKQDEIDRIKHNLENRLKELRRSHLNEPTYFFKVGDKVKIGNITKSIVSEVLDNGKIYKIHHQVETRKHHKDISYEYDSYSTWVNVRPYIEDHPTREKSFIAEVDNYRQISYSNSMMEGLLGRYYGSYAGIETEPDYQRELVWDLEDKVALIDSIFKKIDIGKFTLINIPYKEDEKASEILDGKQRLNAIIEFYEDRFEYRGKTYSQLNTYDKHHFKSYNVNLGETTPMTQKEKYEYFLRLNTGGKPQDQKHINYVKGLLK